jgi:hypothetical protein
MKDDLRLLAYCGLFCGACSFKLAVDENERAHVRSLPARYDKAKEAELQACPGCRSEPTADGDDPCAIRSCARTRGLEHCGACALFPCGAMSEFAADGVPHHGQTLENLRRLGDVGTPAWLAEQRERWTCACGAKRSWYIDTCPKCGVHLPNHLQPEPGSDPRSSS